MKKLLIRIVCGVVCLGIMGCSNATTVELKEKELTIEYGQDPYKNIDLKNVIKDYDNIKKDHTFTLSLTKDDNTEIKEDDITEDHLLEVGEYVLHISYEKDVTPLELPVEVKDTVAPEFKDFKEKVSVDYGYSKDLAALFSATDLADVKISIDGDVNIKKAGDYKVKVIAEDANGNKTEKDCTITVKAKPKEESTTTSNSNSSSSGSTNSSSTSSGNVSSNTNKKPSSSNGNQSSSSNSSNSGGSSTGTSGSNQQACVVPDNQIGNSGMVFATEQEAYEYGKKYQYENQDIIRRYFYGAMYDTCNNIVGYTVDFVYRETPLN